MGCLLIIMSLWLCHSFMVVSGVFLQDANYYFRPIYYSFGFGPLLYFYVRSIVNSAFRFQLKDLIHFIPMLLQGALYVYLSFRDYSYRSWYWQDVHLPYTYRIEFDGTFISIAIYLFFAIRLLKDYQFWSKESYSELSQQNLNWLRIVLILLLVLVVQWFVEVILRDVYDNYSFQYTPVIMGLLTLYLAYRAFMQSDQAAIVYEPTQKENIPLAFDADVLDSILRRMTQDKDYLAPKLSLKTFAANCKLPQKTVSQYLNQHLKLTFHDFVNGYRVTAFKEMVATAKLDHQTLEGVAYDCGFNSKATFNRIFKKITGMTPSQYVSKQSK